MNKSYEKTDSNNSNLNMKGKKIGILGAGNMGGAIIKGLCNSGISEVTVYDPNSAALEKLLSQVSNPFETALSPEQLIEQSDVFIIAIKPQMFAKILPQYNSAFLEKPNMLVVSIAAGKKLSEIAEFVGDRPIARVMPNLAAAVGEAISALCFNQAALENDENREIVSGIFETIGKVTEIDETHFSVFTAIAGCSPAFVMLFIDALAASAVRYGLSKKQALEIAVQVAKGTALLMESYDGALEGHPRVLIDNVCSPGGTTIEGVAALQEFGLENVVAKAVEASYNKDKSM